MAGLFSDKKILTQLGYLHQTTGQDRYGNTSVSTVSIPCYVYARGDNFEFGGGIKTGPGTHFALIPASLTVGTDDTLATVVNSYGDTIITGARVIGVDTYSHWRRKLRFHVLRLDIGQGAA